MSFVLDQISRLDALIDQLEVAPLVEVQEQDGTAELNVDRLQQLRTLATALSVTPTSKISSWKLQRSLETIINTFDEQSVGLHTSETDLRWLVVSKASLQVYGIILNTLLNQILPLTEEIEYWDNILKSYTYSSLYTLQTSPIRLWSFGKDIYSDTKDRVEQLIAGEDVQLYDSVSARWQQYYGLVKDSIHDRSLANLQSKFTSPFSQARFEARTKQRNLKRLRNVNACALGILMDDGFDFPVEDPSAQNDVQQIVSRSIVLMNTALRLLSTSNDLATKDFEDQVYSNIDDYVEHDGAEWNQPPALAQNLFDQLTFQVPQYLTAIKYQVRMNGRPTGLLKYWLPATALILISATLLRTALNRRAAILQWIRDLGGTSRDFWFNWVVTPIKKIISTIRHDKTSDIALISRESLASDRESLERMVVQFAVDTAGAGLSPVELEDLKLKVREGDLTPVLTAYEKDIKRPIMGVLRGDLARTLLIQIQKAKVDVEVALGGIDALLKSQELLFGFFSVTPGVLVVIGLYRWLVTGFGSSQNRTQKQQQMSLRIRSVHRILTKSYNNGETAVAMSYKDRGLLLTEIHVLRGQLGKAIIPKVMQSSYLQDLDDLADVRTGVANKIEVVHRLCLFYGKYF